jgi:pimeloyl-ACP methyl ester carboxylesterase
MEKAFKFGSHEHLVGIISAPDDMAAASGRAAIVFLNAGLVHRVGPYRIHVELGRVLATEGYLALRFDLSGIGDSQFTPETREYKEMVKRDIQDAMDFLQQRYKAQKFVLIGNCSGAFNAQMAAAADDRISGLVLMDGFAARTFGYYYTVFKKYLKNPYRFFRTLGMVIDRRIKKIFEEAGEQPDKVNMFWNHLPQRTQLASELIILAQRGVAMLCIYSGGLQLHYNYANQFSDIFSDVDFRGTLQLGYFANADHTYTSYPERRKLIEFIRKWVNENHRHLPAEGANEQMQAVFSKQTV